MQEGYPRIGEIELEAPEYQSAENAPALAYVRPHDIDIQRDPDGSSAFKVVISHIHTIGPVIRLELSRADESEIIEAELTRERFRELNLQTGEHVYVKPRNVRLFLDA